MWKRRRSSDKRYSGDNRLIASKSSKRAPRKSNLAVNKRLISVKPRNFGAIPREGSLSWKPSWQEGNEKRI